MWLSQRLPTSANSSHAPAAESLSAAFLQYCSVIFRLIYVFIIFGVLSFVKCGVEIVE